MRHTFLDLLGMSFIPSPVFGSDSGGGGGGDSGSDSGDSGGGYTGFIDMIDGGGPGASGDSFSTVDNTALDKDGDGHISSSEAGGQNLAGGIDGSEGKALDFNGDGVAFTGIGDMFDGGGAGASGDTYSTRDNTAMDTNNDGHISYAETSAAQSGNNNLYGGIDGSSNIDTTNSVTTALSGSSAFNDSGSSSSSSSTSTNTNTNTSTDTSTSGGSDTSTSTTTTSTDTTNNDLISDLESQIAALQDQLAGMSGGGGTTVVYEGSGGTETALPDDYLTEADLARYFDNLDLGSNAYDPAAFLNAYGFALDPAAYGGIIPTFSNTNGVYMRRAVKDKDTGEIRYVNVPIGAGAMGGNDGLSMFRNERRSGFGSFV